MSGSTAGGLLMSELRMRRSTIIRAGACRLLLGTKYAGEANKFSTLSF